MSWLILCHQLICLSHYCTNNSDKYKNTVYFGERKKIRTPDFVNIVTLKGSKHSGRSILANIIEVFRHNLKTNSPRNVKALGLVRESLNNFVQIARIFYLSVNSSKQYCAL